MTLTWADVTSHGDRARVVPVMADDVTDSNDVIAGMTSSESDPISAEVDERILDDDDESEERDIESDGDEEEEEEKEEEVDVEEEEEEETDPVLILLGREQAAVDNRIEELRANTKAILGEDDQKTSKKKNKAKGKGKKKARGKIYSIHFSYC